MPHFGMKSFAGFHVPETNCVIRAAGNETFAVGREGYTYRSVSLAVPMPFQMSLPRSQFLAPDCIPKLNPTVPGGGSQEMPVGGKSDGIAGGVSRKQHL